MSEHQIGDAPIEPGLKELMNVIARTVDDALNPAILKEKQWGFVLLTFPFHDHDGRCNYISNAQRADIVVLLREQLARFEGRVPDASGRA